MTDKKSTHQEINIEELNALIERVEHAIENELALSVDDLKLLLSAIHTLSTLQRSLEDKNATLYKLRKLLGMIKQSERRPSGNNNLSNKKRNKNSKEYQVLSTPKCHKKNVTKTQKNINPKTS